jgi:ABC-type Na+ efflux pump permease subunit
MFGSDSFGRWMIVIGLGLAAIGVLMVLLSRAGIPIGRLPGDIRLQGQNITCLIPLASMILISLILTIAINLLLRLFK